MFLTLGSENYKKNKKNYQKSQKVLLTNGFQMKKFKFKVSPVALMIQKKTLLIYSGTTGLGARG